MTTDTQHVSDQFKIAAINMIKKILKDRRVTRSLQGHNSVTVTCSIVGTDISIDFYDANNSNPTHCDLSIGNDKIRCVGEHARQLYAAFHERIAQQSKENTATKEHDLMAKLNKYLQDDNTK